MSFTTIAENKGNWLHILGKGVSVSVFIQEFLVFNMLQPAMLYLPVLEKATFIPQVISVKRVLASSSKEAESLLQTTVNFIPQEIVSCRIKNINMVEKLITGDNGKQALAFAIYTYEVELVMTDKKGTVRKIILKSGQRHQEVLLTPSEGKLKVTLYAACQAFNIKNKTNKYRINKSKPLRLWLFQKVRLNNPE